MIINNITLFNYRLYEGTNTIKFSPADQKNIYLISGENGFGKTTFLHSLLWCLYGRLISDIEAETRKDIASLGYNAFLKSNLNHNVRKEFESIDEKTKSGIKKSGYTLEHAHLSQITTYYVSIEFSDVVIPSLPCTTLTIRRSYDMVLEKETVEILIDGVKNELTREIGPEIFINDFILNKDIAQFFFFDSEQIVSLAETNTPTERRRLCSAYNEVLGVRKYEDLKKNLENIRLRFRKKSSDIEHRERLLALIAKRDSLNEKIDSIKKELEKAENHLVELRNKDGELQMRMVREGNNTTREEINKLEGVIKVTKQKDEEYKGQLKRFLEYAPLAIAGNLLSQAKQQVEHDFLLRNANNNQLSRNVIVTDISKDLQSMLTNLSMGKSSTEKLRKEIQKVLDKYVDSNNLSDIQISLTDDEYEEFMAVYNHITTTYRLEFERLSDDYKKNKQVLERNSRKLSNIQGNENDELIKNIRAQKNKIEDAIRGIDNNIKGLHEDIGTNIQELATTNKQISEISKLVSLDDTDEKKDSLSKQLIEELSDFLYQLKIDKKYSLERRIKSILNTLMHKADFIGHVEVVVSDDDMDIELYSVDGRKIHKDTLSKGEQQLYATSILKALVEESGIQFPVFIDSPLQKFDKSHATKIITEFYPSISKQVVLFPLLHKELTIDEFEIMKDSVNETFIISNDTTHSYFEKVPINNFMTF
jgi:DNA sulfur modification protein DndD